MCSSCHCAPNFRYTFFSSDFSTKRKIAAGATIAIGVALAIIFGLGLAGVIPGINAQYPIVGLTCGTIAFLGVGFGLAGCKQRNLVSELADAISSHGERESAQKGIKEKIAAYAEEIEGVKTKYVESAWSEQFCKISNSQLGDGLSKEAGKTLDLATQSVQHAQFTQVKQLCTIAEIRLKINPNTIPNELERAEKLEKQELSKIQEQESFPAYFLAQHIPQLCVLAKMYHQVNKLDKVKELLEKAKKYADGNKQQSVQNYISNLQIIVDCQKSCGLDIEGIQKSIQFYANFNQKLKVADKENVTSTKVKAYCQIATELVNLGDKETATIVLDMAAGCIDKDAGLETESYCNIAKVRLLITPKQIPDELETAKELEKDERSKNKQESPENLLPGHVKDLCWLAETYHLVGIRGMNKFFLDSALECARYNTARTAEYLNNLLEIAACQIRTGLIEDTNAKKTLTTIEQEIGSLRETGPEILKLTSLATLWLSIDSTKSKPRELITQAKGKFSREYLEIFEEYPKRRDMALAILSTSVALNNDTRLEENPFEKFTFNESETDPKVRNVCELISTAQTFLSSKDFDNARQSNEKAKTEFSSYTGKDCQKMLAYSTAYNEILKAEKLLLTEMS